MSTIFKNRVAFDLRIYSDCKKYIARHRRLAIFERLVKSVIADGIQPDNMDAHDKMFVPENIHEETFWKSCREMAKSDRRYLLSSIENGKKGGRPHKVDDIIQKSVENLTASKGKDLILIDNTFHVANHAIFKPYVQEMPTDVIESVENWLKDKKQGQKVRADFITTQFINFANRQNKPLFKK